MPSISLCMIVKNDERHLEEMLKSIHDLMDEIIIVLDKDSGGREAEIAAGYGARIICHEWKDDFSDKRNVSLKNAAKDWILVLDADEVMERSDVEKMKGMIEPGCAAYLMPVWTYTNDASHFRWQPADNRYCRQKGFRGFYVTEAIRLFKNHLGIRFSGAVHEIVDGSVIGMGMSGKIRKMQIPVHHFQSEKGEAERRRKNLLYLRLSEKEMLGNPGYFKPYFDAGIITFRYLGNPAEAAALLEKSIELNPGFMDSYFALGLVYMKMKEYGKAKCIYEKITTLDPGIAGAYFNLGIAAAALGKYGESVNSLNKALHLLPAGDPKIKEALNFLDMVRSVASREN